jgi:hypothetical protein
VIHKAIALTIISIISVTSAAYGQVPTRYGGGLTAGTSYDPSADISWLQGTVLALYDYETIWRHRAPEPLRFKVEGNAGTTIRPETRIIASTNMLALYYLDDLASGPWRPYMEAGIGIIYMDFTVEGQGLRLNFNPQMGLGTEYTTESGDIWYGGFRAHHISNAGLDDENRGVNSVVLTLGVYF